MTINRSWGSYRPTYRAREMEIIAGWLLAGESGAVVGLPGVGRSNLLGFLGHRPDVLQTYLAGAHRPVAPIPVDLNNLPASNLATLYRVILRAIYRVRERFTPTLQQRIADLYQQNQAERDAFLPQSALQELLLLFQAERIQIVLVLNRFDRFCQMATPAMVNTLRGLRDDFKDTLCYLVGMSQEATYLADPARLGLMAELVDHYVCWVGAMTEADSRQLIAEATHMADPPPAEAEIERLLALTGGYPVLLRAACTWWLTTPVKPPPAGWAAALLAERSVQDRLNRLWAGLTQEEQFVVAELQRVQAAALGRQAGQNGSARNRPEVFDEPLQRLVETYEVLLGRLAAKGICYGAERGWSIRSELVAAYVATLKGRSRGRIWRDETTGELYQGQTPLCELTALERAVLAFLLEQPYVRHTKTDLIINTWPDELSRGQGVSDNSLYQVIFNLRQAIEITPTEPVYLLTWRGKPEGGYQFFPEGRPR